MNETLKYTLIPGRHCFYGSLANIMHYYHSNLSESDIFFLCNGLKFSVDIDMLHSQFNMCVLECIQLDYIKQVVQFSNSLPCRVDFLEKRSQTDILEFIRDALCDKDPPLFFLNSKILKYLIYQNPMGHLGAHSVVVYGLENYNILYSDVYNPDYLNNIHTYIGRMEVDQMSQYLIQAFRFHMSPTFLFEDKEVRIKTALQNSLEQYLDGTDSSGKICGHKALRCVLEYACDASLANPEECQPNFIALILLIKSYFSAAVQYLLDVLNLITFSNGYDNDQYNKDIHILGEYWTSFHQRCLSSVHKSDALTVQKIKDSGNHVFFFQEKLFQQILSSLTGR